MFHHNAHGDIQCDGGEVRLAPGPRAVRRSAAVRRAGLAAVLPGGLAALAAYPGEVDAGEPGGVGGDGPLAGAPPRQGP